jgi:hypothetical protein
MTGDITTIQINQEKELFTQQFLLDFYIVQLSLIIIII